MATSVLEKALLEIDKLGLTDDLKKEIDIYLGNNVKIKCNVVITSGKYKNTKCSRDIHIDGLCKIHAKHLVCSKVTDEEPVIKLKEKIINGVMCWVTGENVVYEKMEKGYFIVGTLKKGYDSYYIQYT